MTTPIAPLELPMIDRLESTRELTGTEGTATADAVSFRDLMSDMVTEANQSVASSEEMTTAFARGDHNDLHGTMIALEQADVRVRLMMEMRNHLLEAYREVARMTV